MPRSRTPREPYRLTLEDLPAMLRKSIVRLMAKENLEFEPALVRASILLDVNSTEFDKAVNDRANAMYKTQLMVQVNKARATIMKGVDQRIANSYTNGYNAGYAKGKLDYEIIYYCNVCRKPLTILPNSDSHKAMIQLMYDNGWGHDACHKK